MGQKIIIAVCFMLLAVYTVPHAQALTNQNHPSVRAALACIKQIAPIVKNRQKSGKDVACDIPVSLSEKDLDELFKAAARSASSNNRIRSAAQKYSARVAKTLTNFRAANCRVKLRIKRSRIINALSADRLVLQLADQPTTCKVTTKAHKIKQLKFAFSPRIDMAKGCVTKFALNMGKVDAGCKVCYFNRLYLSTKLVGLWANSLGDNVKRALNVQLGGRCL